MRVEKLGQISLSCTRPVPRIAQCGALRSCADAMDGGQVDHHRVGTLPQTFSPVSTAKTMNAVDNGEEDQDDEKDRVTITTWEISSSTQSDEILPLQRDG